MKVLVTGGAGFIGSHLCDALVARGDTVTALDNFITGRRDNVAHLLVHPGFRLVEHDLIQPYSEDGWDAVFHLASPASPVGYMQHPLETLLVNSQGTYHALELARRSGARFLLASTSEVYGDPQVHPQREDYWGNVNPVGPRACYDEGKRYAEAITMTYVKERQLDGRIIRIFNTYGPRNDPDDGRMVPNFVKQAVRGDGITVYGDGQQTRSVCYVADLVEGIQRAMFTAGTTGQVINLGNPGEHTVLDYARLVKELTNSSAEIRFLPGREEEIARRQPDIAKAIALLGWQPSTNARDGLARTIAWMRGELDRLAGLGAGGR